MSNLSIMREIEISTNGKGLLTALSRLEAASIKGIPADRLLPLCGYGYYKRGTRNGVLSGLRVCSRAKAFLIELERLGYIFSIEVPFSRDNEPKKYALGSEGAEKLAELRSTFQ